MYCRAARARGGARAAQIVPARVVEKVFFFFFK
jgi:hypothetical protein